MHNIDIFIGIIIYGLRADGYKPPSRSHLSKEKGKIVHDLFLFYLTKTLSSRALISGYALHGSVINN